MYRYLIFALLISSIPVLTRADPLTVGAMAELSGPFQSIGEECLKGYKVAEAVESRFAAGPSKVVYSDHQRKPRVGLSEFQKLVQFDKAIGIASNAAPVVMAMNSISKKMKVPLLGTVVIPAFTKDNPYAYRFWPSADIEANIIADLIHGLGLKKMAVVTVLDDYPVSVTNELRNLHKLHGGSIILDESFAFESVDLQSLLLKIKNKGPDVVFLNILGDRLAEVILKAREAGITQQIIGTFSLSRPDILAATKGTAEGVIFVEVNGDKPIFLAQLNALFGVTRSTGPNYTCYAALATLLKTIRVNPQVKTSAELAEKLSALQQIELLDESLVFQNREAKFDFNKLIVRKGKIENFH